MSLDLRMDRVRNYYSNYNEDLRIQHHNSRRTEFLTTNYILERYLKPNSLILDLGAATGCYSFHYAQLGHRMVARDLTPQHIEAMQLNPLCSELGIDAAVADGRDLSEFEDGVFDAVLCLGPLYHLGEQDQRAKCISECVRVLKPGGILAAAYISKFFVYAHLVRQKKEYLCDELMEEILSNEVSLKQNPQNIWFFDSPQEIEALFSDFDVERVTHAATDGISILLADMVNSLSDEEYNQWLNYLFKTCEEPSTLGYSNHNLYVCRKTAI